MADRRRGLRTLIWSVAMLLLGVVVGGAGPRAALRDAQAELDRLDPRHCERTAVGREVARAIASGISSAEPVATQGGAPARRPRPRPAPVEERAAEQRDEAPEGHEPDVDFPREFTADALDLRRQQAMAALVQQARPDREQLAAIEAVVDTMNDNLAVLSEDIVALASSDEEPTRLDWMWVASDVLDVLIEAELGLHEALTDRQLDAIDASLVDPFSFVDGSVTEPLQRMQGGGF